MVVQGLLVAVSIVSVLAACSDGDGFDISERGEAMSVFDLGVGHCFDDPDDTAAEVEEVDVVDCDEPHDNEVYLVFDFEAADFPGEEAIRDEALDRCIEEFESYVGVPIDESQLDAGPLLVPTEQSWEVGDREVVCAAWSPEGAKLEESIEGSEQ